MPINPLSLKKNVAWTFLGNAVFAGCKWLIIVIIAKQGSPEMVGIISLGIAITAPIIAFSELQLRSIVITDVDKENNFQDYFGLRIITIILAIIIILAVIIFTRYSYETSIVILFTGLERCAFSLSNIIHALYQQYHRMDKISHSLMIKGILSAVFAGATFYYCKNVIYVSLTIAIIFWVTLFCYDMPVARLFLTSEASSKLKYFIKPHFNLLKIWGIIKITLPLGIAMMLGSLNINIPRYIIEQFCGTHGLGIYAAIAAPAALGDMIITAVSQSSVRHYAEFYSRGNTTAFQKLLFKNLLIALLLAILGLALSWLAGKEILTLLYNKEYAQYKDLFMLIILVFGISFSSMICFVGITATRKFAIQIPVNAGMAVIITLGCYVLIPRYGLTGAALALIFSQCLAFVTGLVIIFKTLKSKTELRLGY